MIPSRSCSFCVVGNMTRLDVYYPSRVRIFFTFRGWGLCRWSIRTQGALLAGLWGFRAGRFARQIVASGFEEGAPDSISVEDACMLSQSSVALALTGSGSQLGIATLGKVSFYLYQQRLDYSRSFVLLGKLQASPAVSSSPRSQRCLHNHRRQP